jgi:hypothetical protein
MQQGVPICDRVSPSWINPVEISSSWCLLDEVLRHFDHAPSMGFPGSVRMVPNSYYGTLEKIPMRPF